MNSHTIQNIEEYKAKREALLKEAFDLKYDGLQFSSDELKANEKFLAICKETKSKLDEKFHFRPILYRNIVESSTLYKLLTDLPKGCQQHSHNPFNLQSKWFVAHCFNPNVYIDDSGRINVFEEAPKEGAWRNLLKVREEAQNKQEFDKTLEDYFHFTLEDFDSSAVWDRFEFKIANRMNICFQSEEIWEQYMTDTFIAAIEEGYSNFQIRNTLPFFEHKCFMDPEKEAQRYRRCLAKAREKDPNFTVGITLSTLRFFDLEKAKKFLDLAYDFSKRYSDVIMGFDLVAEENRQTAEFFSPMFLEHRKVEKEEGHDLPLILHGGESLDVGNTNLYDLYLINAKRIGHGLNLFKHPYLIPKIKEKGICIEVNPLSNQILKYVSDLRLHPAIGYHNFGLKISISSDDIGIFNLYTIWDFFCIAISFEFDLLDMKRVILNSIETSCLEKSVQEELHKDWQNKWDAFISKVNSNKYV